MLSLSVNEASIITEKEPAKKPRQTTIQQPETKDSKALLRRVPTVAPSPAKQSKRFADLMTVSYEDQFDAINLKLNRRQKVAGSQKRG